MHTQANRQTDKRAKMSKYRKKEEKEEEENRQKLDYTDKEIAVDEHSNK